MTDRGRDNQTAFLLVVALVSWLLPGAGYYLLRERYRAIIIFVTIMSTLCVGLYIGSIGVIDLVGPAALYVKAAQVMNPPLVLILGRYTAGGAYRVHGWPNEIGQIYTMTSGLLNLLCVINAVYLAHQRGTEPAGD
jgi:hypothetical protein